MIKIEKYLFFVLLAVALFVANSSLAAIERLPATNTKSGRPVVSIPAHAIEVSKNVFSLGESVDPESGRKVEGFLIVHPRAASAKPDGTPGNGNAGKGSKCYTFLASSAKWKSSESWVVNPSNNSGISDASIFSILDDSISKWESAAGVNILGFGSITSDTLEANLSFMDGLNEVYFAPLDEGTIGITIVWGVFGGPPSGRELLEWDQVYSTEYDWSLDGSVLTMDFDNITTHELGHSVGLGDLYDTSCSSQTMYGYADYSETNKRTLESGDVEGIRKLYR